MELIFANGDIARVIDLAVAPVFLLTAISGTLSVLSTRLGRIIDRGRRLKEMQVPPASAEGGDIDTELKSLAIRARLIHRAIRMCTTSALFVCLVIISLFLDALFSIQMEFFIAAMFMFALGSLSFALLTFLREIGKSTAVFQFGRYKAAEKIEP